MQTNELHYWLAASHFRKVSVNKINKWITHLGSIEALFSATKEELREIGLKQTEIESIQKPDWKAVEQDIQWAQKPDCYLIVRSDVRYPALLRELNNDAPLVLYVRGQPAVLSRAQLAIVGTRNPTVMGKELASEFAKRLAKVGLIITSGLAQGVDAASHMGALHVNAPTIAVIGTGQNVIYPREHAKLAEKMIEQGAIVSEFPINEPPMALNFPRRNRIISGLSLGVLVVEAAIRSGSLITARFATEQGREVFAIPGSIHNPQARGCHKLIQQGAKLIEKVEDIMEEFKAHSGLFLPDVVESKTNSTAQLDQKTRNLLGLIGDEITTVDMLLRRSGLTVAEVSSMLLSLELRSYVQIVPGGYVKNSPR